MIAPVMTLGVFYRTVYEPQRLLGRSPATKADYKSALEIWKEWAGLVPIDRIAADDLAAFLAHLAKNRAPATVNKHRRYLLSLLRFAKRKGLTQVRVSSLKAVARVPEPKKIPRAWTISEVVAITAQASMLTGHIGSVEARAWWRSLITTVYHTGGRIGAVLEIRPCDVDLHGRWILLRAESQKQNTDQLLPVCDELADAIAAVLDPTASYLFVMPFARKTLDRRFCRLCRAAGVSCGHASGGVWHKLRRTHASYCKAAGGDPTAQLGHSSPRVTAAYLDPRIAGCRPAQLPTLFS